MAAVPGHCRFGGVPLPLSAAELRVPVETGAGCSHCGHQADADERVMCDECELCWFCDDSCAKASRAAAQVAAIRGLDGTIPPGEEHGHWNYCTTLVCSRAAANFHKRPRKEKEARFCQMLAEEAGSMRSFVRRDQLLGWTRVHTTPKEVLSWVVGTRCSLVTVCAAIDTASVTIASVLLMESTWTRLLCRLQRGETKDLGRATWLLLQTRYPAPLTPRCTTQSARVITMLDAIGAHCLRQPAPVFEAVVSRLLIAHLPTLRAISGAMQECMKRYDAGDCLDLQLARGAAREPLVRLRQLVADGARPTAFFSECLVSAVQGGRASHVRYLLAVGARSREQGVKLLGLAIDSGSKPICRMLVVSGARPWTAETRPSQRTQLTIIREQFCAGDRTVHIGDYVFDQIQAQDAALAEPRTRRTPVLPPLSTAELHRPTGKTRWAAV